MQLRYSYQLNEARNLVYPFLRCPFAGYDIETYGNPASDPVRAAIRLVSISDGANIIVVDFPYTGMFPELEDFLQNPKIKKLAHHHKFEYKMFKGLTRIAPRNIYCTMVAEQVVRNGLDYTYNLEDVCDRRRIAKLDKTKQKQDWSKPLTPDDIRYSGLDSLVLPHLYQRQLQDIEELQLRDVIELEMQVLPVIADMEMAGIIYDVPRTRQLQSEVQGEVDQQLREIQKLLPPVPLPKSSMTKKMLKIYPTGCRPPETNNDFRKAYVALGIELPTIRDPKTKEIKVSLSESTYEKVPHPTGKMLKEYFKTKKLVESYLNPVFPDGKDEGWIHPYTGRIHGNIKQCGARTGRFSMSDPPLQTIPRKDKRFRHLLIPPQGYVLMKADYSQIELRVMAQVSGDENLIRAYQEGKDVHRITVANIFSIREGREVLPDEINKDDRNNIGKPVNFGSIYDQSPPGLQDFIYGETGIVYEVDECALFQQGFFQSYPGIKRYHRIKKDATLQRWEDTYAERTLFGRVRFWSPCSIPKVRKVNRWGEPYEYTICKDVINHPIQGTVGDMMKRAMVLIAHYLRTGGFRSYLVLQVHDEVVLYVEQSEIQAVAILVGDAMLQAGRELIHLVPLEVEVSAGPDWGTTELVRTAA